MVGVVGTHEDQGDMMLDAMSNRDRIARLEKCIAYLENRIFDLSQTLAEKEHGRDVVKAAVLEAQKQSGLMETFARSPHPFDELMQWHNRTATQ
jgi:hypothetical protein